MAGGVTKNPQLLSTEIGAENERRRKSIQDIQVMSAAYIRGLIRCSLDPDARPVLAASPAGELLYVNRKWLVRPADRREHDGLIFSRSMMLSGGGLGMPPPIPTKQTLELVAEIGRKLDAIYVRGSDHLRAAVGRAADWACVPPEMLAAVLQGENRPDASGGRRGLQALERGLQDAANFFGLNGSTGFGNVKPDTLKEVEWLFSKYYRSAVLAPGVPRAGQNDNAETDIYHAAAVLRDDLNRAWSIGPTSLQQAMDVGPQSGAPGPGQYQYFPYFGGTVTKDVAIRAMGRYTGFGNAALANGQNAMHRLQKNKLYFLPPL